MKRFATLLVVLLVAVPALAAETVTVETRDGMKIAGTWYPSGARGAPGVVALHMYRHDRSTWKPVAERFTKAGIDFLAIDMRGHGDSAVQKGEDLAKRVKARDATLFNAMWQDALAAVDFLEGKGTDRNRIALLGASVGCSVAIDAAARSEAIRGVCVMTPGEKYLGVDTMSQLSRYGKRPMLILSSKEEAKKGADGIAKKLGPSAEVVLYEGTNIHGTRMFGKVPGVEEKVVGWLADLVGAPAALDGMLSDAERPEKPLAVLEGVGSVFVRRHGSWLHVAIQPEAGAEAPHGIEVAWADSADPKRAASVRWTMESRGYQHRILRDGSWMPIRRKEAPHTPHPGAARGAVVEMVLPADGTWVKVFAIGPKGEVGTGWLRP